MNHEPMPSSPASLKGGGEHAALVALLALVTALSALRFVGLGWASYWHDELWQVNRIAHPFSPFYHGVYTSLLCSWAKLWQTTDEATLRSLGVGISLVNAGLLWMLAARFFGRATAWGATLVLLLLPYDLFLARQLREYPPLIGLTLIAAYGYLAWQTEGRRRWLLPLALSLGLGLLTHVFFAYFIATLMLHLFLTSAHRWRTGFILLLCCAALLLLSQVFLRLRSVEGDPFLAGFAEPARLLRFFSWRNLPRAFVLFSELLCGPVRVKHVTGWDGGRWLDHAAMLLFWFLWAGRCWQIRREPRQRSLYLFLLIWMFMPALCALAVEQVFGLTSVVARYLSPSLPAFAIGVALIAVHGPTWRRLLLLPLFTVMLVCNAGLFLMQHQGGAENLRGIAAALASRYSPGQLVISDVEYLPYYERRLLGPDAPIVSVIYFDDIRHVSTLTPLPVGCGRENQDTVLRDYYQGLMRRHDEIWIEPLDDIPRLDKGLDTFVFELLAQQGYAVRDKVSVASWPHWNGSARLHAVLFVKSDSGAQKTAP